MRKVDEGRFGVKSRTFNCVGGCRGRPAVSCFKYRLLSFPLTTPPPNQVAQIVKKEMESAVKLYVKLKAKVKVGPSWGNLQDLDI